MAEEKVADEPVADERVDTGDLPATGALPLEEIAAVDTGSLPMTAPNPAPIFDTGPLPEPLPGAEPEPPGAAAPPAAAPRPARSLVVSGQYQFLKWWQLLLVLLAVWVPAAGIGLGLFSWWFGLADKTPAVFVALVYTVVCLVAGIIVAMVGEKPLVAAAGMAITSAVFVSGVAAAPLYGHHFCQHVARCLGGILPY